MENRGKDNKINKCVKSKIEKNEKGEIIKKAIAPTSENDEEEHQKRLKQERSHPK